VNKELDLEYLKWKNNERYNNGQWYPKRPMPFLSKGDNYNFMVQNETSDKEIIIELIRIGSLVHHVFLHLHIFTKDLK